MPGETSFALHFWDYFAFLAFFVLFSAIGFWAGRKERTGATEYFLAGKRLPWYVGVAIVYGICVAMSERGQCPLLYASHLVLH